MFNVRLSPLEGMDEAADIIEQLTAWLGSDWDDKLPDQLVTDIYCFMEDYEYWNDE